MSFLTKKNSKRRLYLQLIGFQSNTYLAIVSELVAIPTFRLPQIKFREADMSRLVMPEPLRLGNRLERFFSFIIQESNQYELLAENIQISKNKITLGELDFLIYDKENKLVLHVELAGKLYLYDPTIKEELARWIGPNRKDSLLKKTKKLREKQFPLLYSEQTKEALLNFNLPSLTIKQQISYKARLFMPHSLKDTAPSSVSKENIKGYYIGFDEFKSYKSKNYSYFIPEKQDWIVAPKYGGIWFSFNEIVPVVEESLNNKMSPLIWLKKPDYSFATIFVVWW